MSLSVGRRIRSVAFSILILGCQNQREREPGPTFFEKSAAALSPGDWVTVPPVSDPVFQGLTIPADAPAKGMWSGVQSWPMNALHATLLPNGNVLTFGTNLDGSQQNGRYYDVWSPQQGFATGSHATTYSATREDSFCATSTFLTDGRLMVSGGNGGVSSQFYTPGTGQLTTGAARLAMNRWYATLVTLPDGRPLMLGGMVPYSEGMQDDPEGAVAKGTPSMTPEIMESTSWRSLFGAYSRDAFGPDYLRCSYPRAFVAPNGKVFGLSSEKMWYLDPTDNGTIQTVGNFKQAYSSTTPVNVGATNTAVMYTIGKILVVGGNGGFNGDGLPASDMATVIDLNNGNPVLTELPRMSSPRRYPNGIALPEGKVLITGGTRRGNNNGADAVYAAEIWNPAAGTWTVGASAAVYRGYHSFSILLPSGVVLSTGGGTPGPVTNLNAEVYYPPSLFRTSGGVAQVAPRPVIIGVSGLSYLNGAALQLDLSSSAAIAGLVLLGTSNGTHSFNSGQRRIPLAFTQDSYRLTTAIPANSLVPPGYYQLVALDANGVPSRGIIIAVGQGVAPPPVPTTQYNPPDLNVAIAAPIIAVNGTASYALTAQAGVTYSWSFGDGSPDTAWSSTASTSHIFGASGVYTVTLTAKATDGSTSRRTFLQGVATAKTASAPTSSSAMAVETRTGASTRLWVTNPDNDTVGVIDTATNGRVATIAVGTSPRTLAVAPNGQIWVVNRGSATISVVDPATLAVTRTVALPRASAPFGLAFAPDRSAAYVSLEGTGALAKLDPATGATVQSLSLGSTGGRHVSVAADGTILVTRFITPPLPGEATATLNATAGGGEVLAISPASFTITRTITLGQSAKTDTPTQGSGVPNYLGAAIVSPDGKAAWVPSKQDNVGRGMLRNALPLDFQNTVRAITSRIDLTSGVEDYPRRVDHDNSGVATAAAFHPSGIYLFVALETSREVALVDAVRGAELLRFDAGRAPQGLALSPDGNALYVQNFMDRTVSVFDLTPLVARGELRVAAIATPASAASESLPPTVLLGKQLFYDARDPRLAKDAYLSCASCHADGGQDGRVWDLTGFGEGLRNTIALAGRAGMGHGFVHWSANFDEIQDFEKQIRLLSGGAGLMTDAQFNTGTRNQPLGDKKAGISGDLDALAAYVGSLGRFAFSPFRNADGTLTAAASAGKATFTSAGCATCHGGAPFTISATAAEMKNVGTIQASSGNRLGAALTGIDVPTLRDVWATAPYLHNGSAPTIGAAVQAHSGVTLSATDLVNVVAYVQQIGGEELGAAGTWKFDEGSGNTAADSSPSSRPITLTNAAWIGGKVGRALQLNGTSSAGSTATAVVDTTGTFSISAWIRLDSLTGWRTAVNQDGINVSGFWLQYSQSLGNKFSLTMHDSDSTSSTAVRAVSSTVAVVGQWYHLTGVRDKAAGTIKLYVNGALEATTSYTGGWAATGSLNVGRGKFGTPNDWFAGAIDQVQAFSGALIDADVVQLFLQGRAASQGAWKFDEGTGATVADSSGAFHPVTLANTTWVDARLAKGVQFNGTTSVGTTTAPVVDTAGTFSIASWVRVDSLTGARTLINQDGVNVSGFWVQYAQSLGNKFAFAMQASDSTTATLYRATSTTTPIAGQWYHLVAVRDKAAGTMKLYVNGALEATTAYTGGWPANGALNVGRGKSGSANDWFAGALDDVQIVPSALGAAEVGSLYGQGRAPLRGSWKFEEGAGTVAGDGSGAGRNLTTTNATWLAAGKVGKALQLNGTSTAAASTAAVLDTAGSFSAAAWVRLDALTGWRTAVAQDGTNVSGFWLQYSQAVGNKFALTVQSSDSTSGVATRALSTTTPVTGQWYHLVGVRDKLAGTIKLYVNGRLEAMTAYTGGWAANGSLTVGRGKYGGPVDWFAGAVDEVQVFAGPLTDADVTSLYTATP
jgi:YVTN family beta-propeller protein